MSAAEIKMLRWMDIQGKMRFVKEEIRLKIWVESGVRWFGHMQKREINTPMRKSELIQVKRIFKKLEENLK
jgi:hypothetical protein